METPINLNFRHYNAGLGLVTGRFGIWNERPGPIGRGPFGPMGSFGRGLLCYLTYFSARDAIIICDICAKR